MRHANPEGGFTLIEVMLALSLLAIIMLGMGATTSSFVRTVNQNKMRNEAVGIVDGQISRIRTEPMYDSIAARYAGTATVSSPPYTFTRTTTITNDATLSGVADSLNDYKRVTVTVTATGLSPAVSRTVTVAAP
jgi:prepilin-type N-terminal cleavage/methylation domain-containing protein